MPQRKRPVFAGDGGGQRRKMVGRVSVAVVKTGDVATVRRITRDHPERAATGSDRLCRCDGRGIAEVDDRHRDIGCAFAGQLLD